MNLSHSLHVHYLQLIFRINVNIKRPINLLINFKKYDFGTSEMTVIKVSPKPFEAVRLHHRKIEVTVHRPLSIRSTRSHAMSWLNVYWVIVSLLSAFLSFQIRILLVLWPPLGYAVKKTIYGVWTQWNCTAIIICHTSKINYYEFHESDEFYRKLVGHSVSIRIVDKRVWGRINCVTHRRY